MSSRAHVSTRYEWALPYVARARLARVAVLAIGLFLSLAFVSFGTDDLLEAPFVAGLFLFAVATGLTCTGGFKRLQPGVLTLVPLLDIATISLFDVIPNADVVDALIALPAMWLGLTLGVRGIALASTSTGLLAIVPGLLTRGVPAEGWSSATSITLLAALAAAGMTLSTHVWARQLRRLEHQGQALQTAVEVKDDFIALVSHELRTPLTSIIGYLDLVEDVAEPLPVEAQLYLGAVSRNADRLLLLITDLLAASVVENTPIKLDLTTVDVAALARLSLDDANQRATEAGLSLSEDLPPGIVVSADASRLLQVLDNLLSNAIKFTPPGGRITVTLRVQGDGVDLVITDTGIGIDAASLPHLATKFFRTPQTTSAAIPGVGLGLMISRAIVEAHHGALSFTSREHEGTSVRIHLPRALLGAAATTRPGSVAEPVAAA